MKRIVVLFLLVLCIITGVFLVYKMDISDNFADVTVTENKARMISGSGIPSASVEISESIVEDPSIGVLYLPYDFTAPVPEGEAVDDSYFDRCVFIGDSRMLGLIKYNAIKPINYCSVGFSVAAYESSTFVRMGENNYTVKDALRQNDDYDAVYIATGLNELGWSLGRFTEKYRDMVEDIKECAGDRPIYIQLIMPVTNGFESSKIMNPYGLKNSDVDRFNDSLKTIALDNEVYYLDCSELFVLDDGSLDPKKSSDGAHLTLAAYGDQLDYYKTHVAAPKIAA